MYLLIITIQPKKVNTEMLQPSALYCDTINASKCHRQLLLSSDSSRHLDNAIVKPK
jgi:hypothetical protein